MTAVPLRVVRSRVPSPVCAWLVPGGEAAAWLEEIAASGVAAHELRLFVVPRSAADATAGALLVVPRQAQPTPVAPGRALPLARRGTRLLVPADGRLWPPIEDAELDALIPAGLHLLHPVFGSVAFHDADALGVSDLVIPQARRDARWDAAHPGLRMPALRGIRADHAPTAEDVLAEGRGDISSTAPDALPAAPGEARPAPSARLLNWLAARLLRLTRNVRRTASEPTWIDHMEGWANTRLRGDISEQRAREIERLLHLLRNDPDVGLRFALPVGGMLTRGVAPPSWTLPARATDFDARRLGGGAPGDAWDVSPEKTRDLIALYRQQAERAIRLGQHRRAAYVFANLLGDLRGAATALERGGHWREAAALFRERLGDPAAAALCLERGGLLTEAIALHLEVGDRLRAAALLDRIGRRPEAERLWRDVVEDLSDAGDRVGAAALLAGELRAPDEALHLLDEDWPRHGQVDGRLRAAVDLAGSLGRGPEACRWVRRARDVPANALVPVVQVLARAAGVHPDATCRAEAEDAVRVLVGGALPVRSDAEHPALLHALVATGRADPLLRRDALRYEASRVRRVAPRQRATSGVETVGSFDLPNLIPESVTVVRTRDGMLVCGTSMSGPGVELHSLGWDGRPRAARVSWPIVGPRSNRPFLRVDEFSRRILIAFPGGSPRLFQQALSADDQCKWDALTPPWIPDGLLGLCAGDALTTWTVVDLPEEPGLLATCHGQSGVGLRTAPHRDDVGIGFVPTATAHGTLVVAASRLWRFDKCGAASLLGQTVGVKDLVVAPRHLGAAFVAVADSFCELWTRVDAPEPVGSRFAEDADAPKATFLGDGRIAVVERERIRLFRAADGRVRSALDTAGLGAAVAVLPGSHEREIAVVTTSGASPPRMRLTRLRFPAVG